MAKKKQIYPGKFYLVGGGPAVRTEPHPFLTKLMEEAGGNHQKVTILTAGSEEPAEANAAYWDLLTSMGVGNLLSPKILCREHAEDESVASMIAESRVVFIAGGAQAKLHERVTGTATERAMKTVWENGGILAGTSAGTSYFGNPMILDGGTSNKHLRDEMIDLSPGLGYIGMDISLDTHTSSRGRFPRLISLMMLHPQTQIIGMDEDTALIVGTDGIAEVFGHHSIYFFDARESRNIHSNEVKHLCMSGIQIHCLRNGDRYDLRARRPLS